MNIHEIGQMIQQHIDENWERIYQDTHTEMVRLYDEIGDSVYGIYGRNLFKAIHDTFKENGMRAMPRLPGSFSISREWGPEDDRQRWMWSKIIGKDGKAIGTIVTVFYHDHLQIRVPRAFRIIALEETGKGEVIEALSRLAPEFKDAIEAKVEIAEYLASLNS